MMKKLICPICGKEFTKESNAQKYCSAKCRRAANRKPKVMELKKFKCNWCGTEFLAERRKKYCCKACCLYACGRLMIRETKPKKVLSLEEVAVLSREAGMSYGEYCVKHNLY